MIDLFVLYISGDNIFIAISTDNQKTATFTDTYMPQWIKDYQDQRGSQNANVSTLWILSRAHAYIF